MTTAENYQTEFTCNICGTANRIAETLARETGRCAACGSVVRFRAMTHFTSMILHGVSLPVPDWPATPGFVIIGVSDWQVYKSYYQDRVTYLNTQFHEPPFLDVKAPDPSYFETADVVVCSEVLEHVTAPVADAFAGLFRILKPGGTLLLTVPWTHEATIEHFADLHDWRVEPRGDGHVLINRAPDGSVSEHENLIFHGGPGQTLEMRLFGLPDLLRLLREAGFRHIRVADERVPEFGIDFRYKWSLPLIAVRPSFG